jgi:hypothetical protein
LVIKTFLKKKLKKKKKKKLKIPVTELIKVFTGTVNLLSTAQNSGGKRLKQRNRANARIHTFGRPADAV